MNRLSIEDRVRIIAALVEGNSVRGTSRLAGVDKKTVLRLLADVGWACEVFQDKAFQNLTCKRIQCDEIWSFCGMKDKNVPAERRGEFGVGDMWTWVALDADTKLVPCWMLGKREPEYAGAFIHDLSQRLAHRIQLTTDGLNLYANAVDDAFGRNIDYSMLIKLYGIDSEAKGPQRRYSPAKCVSSKPLLIQGRPDPAHVSTSYIERQNLTMRMGMRRFTRLTNGFSKKAENHARSLALHFMYYNFCRKHQTLKTTPAIAAGVADHTWTLHEVVRLADEIKMEEV